MKKLIITIVLAALAVLGIALCAVFPENNTIFALIAVIGVFGLGFMLIMKIRGKLLLEKELYLRKMWRKI